MTTTSVPDWDFDDEFDGGEETCGRVIVNLYLYIRDQEPGRRILVISRDPGAPVELPAWCRMTSNRLTKMQHPYYLITLKPELLTPAKHGDKYLHEIHSKKQEMNF
jgi:TusA-related sulfurtransferase